MGAAISFSGVTYTAGELILVGLFIAHVACLQKKKPRRAYLAACDVTSLGLAKGKQTNRIDKKIFILEKKNTKTTDSTERFARPIEKILVLGRNYSSDGR
jgi:hypothetical protein